MLDLTLPNMTCGGCARGVTAAIKALDAAAELQFDVPARKVKVTTTASAEAVTRAVTHAGFPPA